MGEKRLGKYGVEKKRQRDLAAKALNEGRRGVFKLRVIPPKNTEKRMSKHQIERLVEQELNNDD